MRAGWWTSSRSWTRSGPQLQTEDALAQSRTEAATSLIAVYKALGGGWETAPLPRYTDASISR